MTFNINLARKVATVYCNVDSENRIVESFSQLCNFLSDNPDCMSWKRKNNVPSIETEDGLTILAQRYFLAHRKSDFPANPGTIPDPMVSIIMQEAYGYSIEECEKIKIEHQHSMCAENCVGALLERYINFVLQFHDWHWCCGDFVKAIDFIKKTDHDKWVTLQIKNRNNSENSSSSAIRKGTSIKKWFRTSSKTGKTRWDKLPESMQGYDLSENGFLDFVSEYLVMEKRSRQEGNI